MKRKENKSPDYHGHRTRMKVKYEKSGLQGFHEYEIVELILSYAIARKDTKPLAKELLKQFKTLPGILDAPAEELRRVKGISCHTALLLKLFKDIAIYYSEGKIFEADSITSPQAVTRYLCAKLRGEYNESFIGLFLSSDNKVLAIEKIHEGTVNKAVVYPRRIVEYALKHHAAKVIVAHNHPSGTRKPSSQDIAVTKAIRSALKTVEIVLLDHIIITASGYYSFCEQEMSNDL